MFAFSPVLVFEDKEGESPFYSFSRQNLFFQEQWTELNAVAPQDICPHPKPRSRDCDLTGEKDLCRCRSQSKNKSSVTRWEHLQL